MTDYIEHDWTQDVMDSDRLRRYRDGWLQSKPRVGGGGIPKSDPVPVVVEVKTLTEKFFRSRRWSK